MLWEKELQQQLELRQAHLAAKELEIAGMKALEDQQRLSMQAQQPPTPLAASSVCGKTAAWMARCNGCAVTALEIKRLCGEWVRCARPRPRVDSRHPLRESSSPALTAVLALTGGCRSGRTLARVSRRSRPCFATATTRCDREARPCSSSVLCPSAST